MQPESLAVPPRLDLPFPNLVLWSGQCSHLKPSHTWTPGPAPSSCGCRNPWDRRGPRPAIPAPYLPSWSLGGTSEGQEASPLPTDGCTSATFGAYAMLLLPSGSPADAPSWAGGEGSAPKAMAFLLQRSWSRCRKPGLEVWAQALSPAGMGSGSASGPAGEPGKSCQRSWWYMDRGSWSEPDPGSFVSLGVSAACAPSHPSMS